jgi:hypothetical protein
MDSSKGATPVNPKLAQAFQKELVASILLQVLSHSDDPELVNEAIKDQPNFEQLHQLLVRHNELKHAQLRSGGMRPRPTAPISPSLARARGVAAIFDGNKG